MTLLLLALVVLALALIALALVALATGRLQAPGWAMRHAPTWSTDTAQRPDGTTLVLVRRAGEEPRTVRELPAGMDPVDYRLELEDALAEADAQVRVLERGR